VREVLAVELVAELEALEVLEVLELVGVTDIESLRYF
jgi:hypothetical protein